MFLNRGGKVYTQTYSGERTEDALTPFCQAFDKKYGPKPGMVSSLPDAYKDGDVVKLDDSNFDDIVLSSNEIWVIKFGAPWCYHCKVFKPKYMEAAEKLGSKVRFGEVDAAGNKGLASRFGIRTLPTIKYFQAGYGKTDDKAVQFRGKRSADDLVQLGEALRLAFDSNPTAY